MKRILITGGAGFIGSHLSERLLNEGNDIICLDNFFTGSKNNIRHLIGHNHFELVRHDVIKEYFAEVDQIYNLACPASPIHYQYNPIKTILIKESEKRGLRTIGGLDMLIMQAQRAQIIWTGKTPDANMMKIAALEALNGM